MTWGRGNAEWLVAVCLMYFGQSNQHCLSGILHHPQINVAWPACVIFSDLRVASHTLVFRQEMVTIRNVYTTFLNYGNSLLQVSPLALS